jgi:hypothetical protein
MVVVVVVDVLVVVVLEVVDDEVEVVSTASGIVSAGTSAVPICTRPKATSPTNKPPPATATTLKVI